MNKANHPPRILFLYGSLRERSYSRLLAEEAARIATEFGAEVIFFDPSELPMYGSVAETHPKVQELRNLSQWSEAQVWSSPELHGHISGVMKNQLNWIPLRLGIREGTRQHQLALQQVSGYSRSCNPINMTGVMKNQVEWIPLSVSAVRSTQGKALAVMQVSKDSQSLDVVNTLRLLGCWMRMLPIPHQSAVANVSQEFHENGTMKDFADRDQVVKVMKELCEFVLHLRNSSRERLYQRTEPAIGRQFRNNKILHKFGS